MSDSRFVRAGYFRNMTSVDRDLLPRAERVSVGGNSQMYERLSLWWQIDKDIDFTGTSTTVDITSSLPANDFVILPHCFMRLSNWKYYVAAVNRTVTVFAHLTDGTNDINVATGGLADTDWTGASSPYSQSTTVQDIKGMQVGEHGTGWNDGDGPSHQEDFGVPGLVVPGLSGTSFTKFRLGVSAPNDSQRKTGHVRLYIPIDLVDSIR